MGQGYYYPADIQILSRIACHVNNNQDLFSLSIAEYRVLIVRICFHPHTPHPIPDNNSSNSSFRYSDNECQFLVGVNKLSSVQIPTES